MSTITFNFRVGGVLTDATSVVFADPAATYGVKRTDNDAVIVPSGTALTHNSTGVYSYTFADPAYDLTYEYWVKWVYAGSTQSIQRYALGPVTPPTPSSTPDPLISLAEYKNFVGIPQSNTSNDLQLNALISAVDAQFNTFLNWHVTTNTYTEVMSGTDSAFLRLKNIPITTLTSITTEYNTESPTVHAGTNFIYNGASGMVYWSQALPALPGFFVSGVLNLAVVYTAGYPQADVPQDIKRAAAMMIQRITKLTSGKADSDFKLDQYSEKSNIISLANELYADVRMILRQWQKAVFV